MPESSVGKSPYTLTLCTSTTQGSLTLSRGEKILKDKVWLKDKSHSEIVTQALADLLKETAISPSDLSLLICTKGPGSFTGIRVALSVIKTLSYAFNTPVIALDDGYAIALNALAAAPKEPVAVIVDAQKNKVFLGVYQITHNKVHTLSEPILVGIEELERHLPEKQYLCLGDGYLKFNGFFSENIKSKLLRKKEIVDLPLASTIFNCVFPLKNEFSTLLSKDVEPLYLRSSAAEEVLAAKSK